MSKLKLKKTYYGNHLSVPPEDKEYFELVLEGYLSKIQDMIDGNSSLSNSDKWSMTFSLALTLAGKVMTMSGTEDFAAMRSALLDVFAMAEGARSPHDS